MKLRSPFATPGLEHPITVLIIEDNPGDRIILSQMLRSIEHTRFALMHAPNLELGLERLSDEVDIILLDLKLPDSCCIRTLDQIRSAAPQIPVIVITGLFGKETGLEALDHGACSYLVKGKMDAHLLSKAILREVRPRPDNQSTAAE